jgi:hypothetical protein
MVPRIDEVCRGNMVLNQLGEIGLGVEWTFAVDVDELGRMWRLVGKVHHSVFKFDVRDPGCCLCMQTKDVMVYK